MGGAPRPLFVVLAFLVTGAALSVATGAGSASPAPEPRPNIVVIMTDDQTVEAVRVMDTVAARLAAKGATFTSSLASYPLCCPSRATYLTGQYAHNHGVLSNKPPAGGYANFEGQNTTLPKALRAAGYRTTHVGKYLNGYGHDDPEEVPPGWDRWFALVRPVYQYFGPTVNANGQVREYGGDEYSTDVLRKLANCRIRKDSDKPEPFFLSIAPVASHRGANPDVPGVRRAWPAPRHEGTFATEPLPMPPSFNEEDVSDKPDHVAGAESLTKGQINAITTDYRAELESLLAVDDLVAGVLRTLRKTDELQNTAIIFTADNGYFHGEHRQPRGKFLHYEPASRVPLIVRGPGFARDVEIGHIVGNVDLAPTILDLAGASPLREPDGRSLVPLLDDPGAPWSEMDLLLETGPPGAERSYAAIRTPQYKYVEWWTGEKELYDLVADPNEVENRAGDPGLAATQADLAARLAVLKTCAGAGCQP